MSPNCHSCPVGENAPRSSSFLHSQFHFRIFFSRGKRRDLRSPVQRLVGYGGNLFDVLSPSKSIVLGSVVPRSGRGGEFPQPKTRLFEKLRTFQIGSDRPCSFLLWRSIWSFSSILSDGQLDIPLASCTLIFFSSTSLHQTRIFKRIRAWKCTLIPNNLAKLKYESPSLKRPANIRIIRILEYNFAHACIPLSEYEENKYFIFEENPSTFGWDMTQNGISPHVPSWTLLMQVHYKSCGFQPICTNTEL